MISAQRVRPFADTSRLQLLLIGGGGFAVLVPLIVVVFVVSSQGVFKKK